MRDRHESSGNVVAGGRLRSERRDRLSVCAAAGAILAILLAASPTSVLAAPDNQLDSDKAGQQSEPVSTTELELRADTQPRTQLAVRHSRRSPIFESADPFLAKNFSELQFSLLLSSITAGTEFRARLAPFAAAQFDIYSRVETGWRLGDDAEGLREVDPDAQEYESSSFGGMVLTTGATGRLIADTAFLGAPEWAEFRTEGEWTLENRQLVTTAPPSHWELAMQGAEYDAVYFDFFATLQYRLPVPYRPRVAAGYRRRRPGLFTDEDRAFTTISAKLEMELPTELDIAVGTSVHFADHRIDDASRRREQMERFRFDRLGVMARLQV